MAAFANQARSTPEIYVDLTNVGSTPGVLDPEQKKRVLRYPDSTLLFLPYDSSTAGGPFSQESARLGNESGRRIVVEIGGMAGRGTWAFVPKAQLEEGIYDEGHWPRVIDICGVFVNCSQDQWDIYKLDPYYHCSVKKFPGYTTVYPCHTTTSHNSTPSPPIASQEGSGKGFDSGMQNARNQPLRRDVTMESITSEAQDDLPNATGMAFGAEMANDQNRGREFLRTPPASPRKQSQATSKTPEADPSTPRRQTSCNGPSSARKRKGFEPQVRPSESEDDTQPRPKRRQFGYPEASTSSPRTPSPTYKATKGDLNASKRVRQKKKQGRWKAEMEARRRQRDEEIMRWLMEDVPIPSPRFEGGADSDVSMQGFSDSECARENSRATSSPPAMSAEERARLASIAESQRKLRELEADKPLWEAAAREREAREAAEAAEAFAKAQARRMDEEAARQRAQRLRQPAATEGPWAAHEDGAARGNTWAAHARQARDRRERMAKWTNGPWDDSRAFERYHETSTLFDATQFSADEYPLTADDVPWPTLRRPDTIQMSLVDWTSVENFFNQLKGSMGYHDYVKLLESSHRRFHPDRWRSRGLFGAVLDQQDRELMEKAATTVSQALTPIWQQAREHKDVP